MRERLVTTTFPTFATKWFVLTHGLSSITTSQESEIRRPKLTPSQELSGPWVTIDKFHSFSTLRLQFEWPHANTKLKKCYWHKFKTMAQWNIADTSHFLFHLFTDAAHLWPDALRWQDVLFHKGFPMMTETKAVMSRQLDLHLARTCICNEWRHDIRINADYISLWPGIRPPACKNSITCQEG